MCAIRNAYIMEGLGDVFKDMPRLKLTLRGIRKVHSSVTRPRTPLTADKLNVIGKRLQRGLWGVYLDKFVWAVLCVAFFGALRCGEFTCRTNFDKSSDLCRGDITFEKDKKLQRVYVALTLKTSKTDPFRKGCTILLFQTDELLCPVNALQEYLKVRGTCELDSPLFADRDGTPLRRDRFITLLNDTLQAVGLNDISVTGHSLRRGFATSASAAKVPDNLISTMGRWRSDCYKLYIDTPMSTVAAAHKSLADPELSESL